MEPLATRAGRFAIVVVWSLEWTDQGLSGCLEPIPFKQENEVLSVGYCRVSAPKGTTQEPPHGIYDTGVLHPMSDRDTLACEPRRSIDMRASTTVKFTAALSG